MNAARWHCPVCQARFRGAAACSRCGADLTPLMLLAAQAWRTRRAARDALAEGDPARAGRLAVRAQQSCFTESGEALRLLAAWLNEESRPASPQARPDHCFP